MGGVQAVVADLVAVGVGDAGDQAPGFESAQGISGLRGGDRPGWQSTQLGGERTQVGVGESVDVVAKRQERLQQCQQRLQRSELLQRQGLDRAVREGLQGKGWHRRRRRDGEEVSFRRARSLARSRPAAFGLLFLLVHHKLFFIKLVIHMLCVALSFKYY